MYDYTRKLVMDLANLTKKVGELQKRVTELENLRHSSGTREVLTLPKNRDKSSKNQQAS